MSDHSETKYLPKVDHTPAELDDVSKALLAGAAYIETNGHATNTAGVDGCKRCAMMSLDEIPINRSVRSAAEIRLRVALGGCITTFNNAHTADEVIARMRAVALGG